MRHTNSLLLTYPLTHLLTLIYLDVNMIYMYTFYDIIQYASMVRSKADLRHIGEVFVFTHLPLKSSSAVDKNISLNDCNRHCLHLLLPKLRHKPTKAL